MGGAAAAQHWYSAGGRRGCRHHDLTHQIDGPVRNDNSNFPALSAVGAAAKAPLALAAGRGRAGQAQRTVQLVGAAAGAHS